MNFALDRATWQGTSPIEHSTFTYDRLGRQTSMTRYQDPQGAKPVTSSWHYDSLGRVLELDEPEAVPQFNTYSNFGELLQVVRNLDASTTTRLVTRYDGLGRTVHTEQQNNGVTDTETVHDYLYDEAVDLAPQVSASHVIGRLALAVSPTSSVAFSYDDLGRVNARTFTDGDGGMYVEKHTTHADGTPAALELYLPDTGYAEEHVAYTYDSAGRGRSVTYANGTYTKDLFEASTIDPFGRVRQAVYGETTYTGVYAETGLRLPTQATVSSASGSRAIQALAFDPLGRQRTRTETKVDDTTTATTNLTYAYDPIGQLQRATTLQNRGLLAVQYSYDPIGNLLARTGSGIGTVPTANVHLTYRDADRDRICHIGYGTDTGTDCNVTYDAVGNIIAEPTPTGERQFSYLADGHVRTITDDHGTEAHFRYDAFGDVQQLELTSNVSADTRQDQHYGSLLAWRNETVKGASTSVLLRSIPGPDGFVATLHGSGGVCSTDLGNGTSSSSCWAFSFGEQRGLRYTTDEHGVFVQDVQYAAYGEATSTGARPGSSLYGTNQWNGGDSLAAFGVTQLGARLYDPVIGRFLSRDPLLLVRTAATSNPYAFASNDPVNRSDPSGLEDGPSTGPPPSTCSDAVCGSSGPGGDFFGDIGDGISDAAGAVAGLFGFGGGHSAPRPVNTSRARELSIATQSSGEYEPGPASGYPAAIRKGDSGPNVFERMRDYYVTTTSDSLASTWANTTTGMYNAVGRIHPGSGNVAAGVTHGIQSGVGLVIDIVVQGGVAIAGGELWEALKGLEAAEAAKGAGTAFKDFNQARNAAVEWLETRGFKAEQATLGKFGENAGKPIGMKTADGSVGFRVEYDARNGAHINVWAGKEKGPHFTFEGN